MLKHVYCCALQDLKPSLVYTRISGYGQTGPKASLPGYASVCEAYGGLRHINGYPGEAGQEFDYENLIWIACLPLTGLAAAEGKRKSAVSGSCPPLTTLGPDPRLMHPCS